MKKAKEWAIWATIVVLQSIILYLALHGESWAGNVVVFMAWLILANAAVSCLGMACGLKPTKEARDKRIDKVDLAYDFAYTIILVGAGWWITAIVYLVGNLILVTVLDSIRKQAAEAKEVDK